MVNQGLGELPSSFGAGGHALHKLVTEPCFPAYLDGVRGAGKAQGGVCSFLRNLSASP